MDHHSSDFLSLYFFYLFHNPRANCLCFPPDYTWNRKLHLTGYTTHTVLDKVMLLPDVQLNSQDSNTKIVHVDVAVVARFTKRYVLTWPFVCDLAVISSNKNNPSHISMTLFQGEDQNTSWQPSARHRQPQTTNNGSWLHRLKLYVIKCESGNGPALE